MGKVSCRTFAAFEVATRTVVDMVTPLVVSLDVPTEPDTFVMPEIDELVPATAAEALVVGMATAIPEGVVDIPTVESPVRVTLSALYTLIMLLAVTLIMLYRNQMELIGTGSELG